jgi:amidase
MPLSHWIEERARQRAKEADEALSHDEVWGPLHGVPVTIKDVFEAAGLRTTASFKPLASYIPKQDATVVARLRQAGAIIMSKNNIPRCRVMSKPTMPCLDGDYSVI